MHQDSERPACLSPVRTNRPLGSLAIAVALGTSFLSAAPVLAQNVLDPGVRDSRPRQGGSSAPANSRTGGRADPNDPRARNQPGLGGGASLDRNLQRGSGGINAPIAQPDFAGRNLLVTGNVAGGRGFRGSVGYTAAGDFRSAAGSDAIFRFQADSALSSTYFLTLRSIDRLSLAQDFGTYEFRRETTPERVGSVGAPTQRFRLDRAAATMASTRTFELEAEAAPFARGRDSANRDVDFVASPVQGIRIRRPGDPIDATGLSTFEKARVRQDIATGKVDANSPTPEFSSPLFDARRDTARDEKKGDGARLDTRVTDPIASQRSSYDQIVKRVLERYGEDPNVHVDANSDAIARARTEIQKVRDALGGRYGEPDEDDPLVDPVTKLPKRPVDRKPEETDPAGRKSDSNVSDKEAERQREIEDARASVSAAAERLRHGTTVRDLTSGERARVDELVRDGQGKLAEGDFFRAERCFTQALELNPDNPLLYAGLAHCQIGAGLHLSAALTLRTLFSNNPEMIDTRYERSLLPNETRVRLAIETLRKRIALGQDADGYGLTLAYLGHQVDDKELVRDGLAVFKGTMENDLLNELLSQLWLGEKPSPAPPTEGAPPAEDAPTPQDEEATPPAKPTDEPSK
jgi:tetratricopeptide (TPR) repeat protein